MLTSATRGALVTHRDIQQQLLVHITQQICVRCVQLLGDQYAFERVFAVLVEAIHLWRIQYLQERRLGSRAVRF